MDTQKQTKINTSVNSIIQALEEELQNFETDVDQKIEELKQKQNA